MFTIREKKQWREMNNDECENNWIYKLAFPTLIKKRETNRTVLSGL